MRYFAGLVAVAVACGCASSPSTNVGSVPSVTYTASGPGFSSVAETAAFSPLIVIATVKQGSRALKDPPSVPSAIAHTYTLTTLTVERVLRGPAIGSELPLVTLSDTPNWESAPPAGTRAVFFLNPRSGAEVLGSEVPEVIFNYATGASSFMPLDGSLVTSHSPELVRLGKSEPSAPSGLALKISDIEKAIAAIAPGTPTLQDQMASPVKGFETANITRPPAP